MRVLITGGAGYLGSVVAGRLLADGYQVRVIDSLMYGGHGLLGLYQHDGFEFIRGDIRSAELVGGALAGVDAVVHLAAVVGDPACARQPDVAKEVNVDASLQLFRLCELEGVRRFVFASTCSNYGRMSDLSAYATEDDELRPISIYAETKVAVERSLLDTHCNDRPAVTILRFATAFGLSPRMRFDLTVNEFTKELVTKRRVSVYGEQFWRPYVHVRDISRAVKNVLEAPPRKVRQEVFNVGDTKANYQKGMIVELVCTEIGGELQVERVHKDEDPRDYRVSFEKLAHCLAFQVEHPVQDGIREIIDAISQGVITDCDSPRYRN